MIEISIFLGLCAGLLFLVGWEWAATRGNRPRTPQEARTDDNERTGRVWR